MKKTETFYGELAQREERDGTPWPPSGPEREQLAATLFGAKLVGCADVVLEDAIARLEGRLSQTALSLVPGSDFSEEERRVIASLGTLDEAQRKAVRELLSSSIYGYLLTVFGKLAQFPHANVYVEIVQTDSSLQEKAPLVRLDGEEMRMRVYDWLERFAEYQKKRPNQTVEPTPPSRGGSP